MPRLFLIILTFGFVLQCTGTASFVKKHVTETEQCMGENQSGEEKDSVEVKKDKDDITSIYNFAFSFNYFSFFAEVNRNFYPNGFYSKYFLPPR